MEQPVVVDVQHVTMKFNLSTEKVDNLKEYFIRTIKRNIMYNEFTALDDVSFQVRKGEVFGLVGLNGSGKSTMLKLVSGIYKPTSGTIRVDGVLAPLIELGAGFDMNLTARENVYLNGSVMGYSKKFLQEKFGEIIDFAELRDFVDVPLKNYSSGMVARLGFAIATVIEPDILICDEILAVGDFQFQQKCEERINQMRAHGVTILFVSHSIEQVQRICHRALWLDHGHLKMIGPVDEVCPAYISQHAPA